MARTLVGLGKIWKEKWEKNLEPRGKKGAAGSRKKRAKEEGKEGLGREQREKRKKEKEEKEKLREKPRRRGEIEGR